MSKRLGTDVFVLAIIKGLKESDDPYNHFGSLLGFGHYGAIAVTSGFIERLPGPAWANRSHPYVLTKKGHEEYERQHLEAAPAGRATFWTTTRWWKEVTG